MTGRGLKMQGPPLSLFNPNAIFLLSIVEISLWEYLIIIFIASVNEGLRFVKNKGAYLNSFILYLDQQLLYFYNYFLSISFATNVKLLKLIVLLGEVVIFEAVSSFSFMISILGLHI